MPYVTNMLLCDALSSPVGVSISLRSLLYLDEKKKKRKKNCFKTALVLLFNVLFVLHVCKAVEMLSNQKEQFKHEHYAILLKCGSSP